MDVLMSLSEFIGKTQNVWEFFYDKGVLCISEMNLKSARTSLRLTQVLLSLSESVNVSRELTNII